jgi:hypothetical protein
MRSLGMWSVAIALLVTIGIAFEYWRLTNPTKLRLLQTITFDTPSGPINATSIVELSEQGAIPYLPGGQNGSASSQGVAPTFHSRGDKIEFVGSPFSMLRYAVRYGNSDPAINWTEIETGHQYQESIKLYSKMSREKTRVYLRIGAIEPSVWNGMKDDFRFKAVGKPERSTSERETLMPGLSATELSREYGVTLQAIEFVVTDAPLN